MKPRFTKFCQQIFLVVLLVNFSVNGQKICEQCTCNSDHSVDCSSRRLSLIFNQTDLWLVPDTNTTIEVLSFNMHNNDLSHVYPFPKLNLVKLDLSSNRIVKIEPESFLYLENMVELDLSDNNLMSEYLTSDVFKGPFAPEDSEPLRSLKILRLSHNALHTLHQDLFEHTDRVEILTLDNNPFSIIDRVTLSAISSLPYLKELDLSYTNIKTLPPYMLHTPKYLTTLNLTGNEIEKLPKTLEDVHQLEWLSLDNNPIESLSGSNVFPNIPTLKVLHLSDMPELAIVKNGALSGLVNLEELYMYDNEMLHTIEPNALSRFKTDKDVENETNSEASNSGPMLLWPPIKIFEIQRNNLTRLSRDLLQSWARLQRMDIRYNLWICDCQNQWIVDILVPIISGLHDDTLSHGVTCAFPTEMQGRNLSELSQKKVEMRCEDLYGHHPEFDGSILVGILIGVLLTIPIMMGILLVCHKKNYCGFVQNNRGPADFSRTFYQRAEMSDDNYI